VGYQVVYVLTVAPATVSRLIMQNPLRVGSPAVEFCAISSYFEKYLSLEQRQNTDVFICPRFAPRKPRVGFNTVTNKMHQVKYNKTQVMLRADSDSYMFRHPGTIFRE
jgi:hypothetical protein